jgi:FixJ family two-component response regulator
VTTARVFVLDADAGVREGICSALRDAGIDCGAAAGIDDVSADERSVLLLDLALSSEGSSTGIAALREAQPRRRVIALAGAADHDRVLDALRAGACDYLVKPIHGEELVLAVRRALEAHDVAANALRLEDKFSELELALATLAQDVQGDSETARERIARSAAQLAAGISGARRSSLMLLDESGSKLRVAAQSGVSIPAEEMDEVPLGAPIAGIAAEIAEPFYGTQRESDPRFAGHVSAGRYATGAFAVFPLGTDAPTSVLCVSDPADAERFGSAELTQLRILALYAGALLSGLEPKAIAKVGAADAVSPAADAAAPAPAVDDAHPDALLALEICDAITAEIEPARIFDVALRPLLRRFEASTASLYLVDAATGQLALEAQAAGAATGDRERLPKDRGLTGSVLQSGRLVASDHPEIDPRFDPEFDRSLARETGPFVCLPLRLRGKVLGVVRIFPRTARPGLVRSAEVAAAALSAAVRNVLLYRSLVESIDEVARARQERGETSASGPVTPKIGARR